MAPVAQVRTTSAVKIADLLKEAFRDYMIADYRIT